MLFLVLIELHPLFRDEVDSPLQPGDQKHNIGYKSASIELGETESAANNPNSCSSSEIDPSNTTSEDCPNGVIRVGIRGGARISGPGGCVYPLFCYGPQYLDDNFIRIKTKSKNATFVDIENNLVVPLGHSRGGYWVREGRPPMDAMYFRFDGAFELLIDVGQWMGFDCTSVCVDPVGTEQCKNIKIQDLSYAWETYKHIWIVAILGAIALAGFIVYKIAVRLKFCRMFSASSDSGTASLGETLL